MILTVPFVSSLLLFLFLHLTSLQNNLALHFHRLQSIASCQNEPPPSHVRVGSFVSCHELCVLNQSQPVAGQCPPRACEKASLERVESAGTRSELTASVESLPVPMQDPSSTKLPSQDQVGSHVIASEMRSTQAQEVTVEEPSLSSNPSSHGRVYQVVARPELLFLCEKMDGKGLRNYTSGHPKERMAIQVELVHAMRVAPEPGAMFLDAMEGFYPSESSVEGSGNKGLFKKELSEEESQKKWLWSGIGEQV